MRNRLGFIVLVIFGSFCVYCAQNVTGGNNGNGAGGNSGNGGGGMVGSAGADTCCTPPDPAAGVVLFDQKFVPTDCYSPAIDVGGYRTIVVHGYVESIQWTFGGAASWVAPASAYTGGLAVLDGRMGKQIRAQFASTNGFCTSQVALTVVGYKQ